MLGAEAVKSGGSKTPPRAVPALPEEGDPFSSLGQRILHLMKINDLTKAEFSRLVGVHQSTVGLWVAGKREEITSEVADRIVEKTGATLAWVMRGRGAPPKSLVEQRIERSQAKISVAAAEQREMVNPARPIIRTLRVRGDQMSPTLNHGDVVDVDESDKDAAGGGVFEIEVAPGRSEIARVQERRGRWRIIFDNQAYAPEESDTPPTILGRVLPGVLRRT